MAARDISPTALARRLQVGGVTVSRWRDGQRPLDVRLQALAIELSTTVAWLGRGEGPRDLQEVSSSVGVPFESRGPAPVTPGETPSVPRAFGQRIIERAVAAGGPHNNWVPLSTVIHLVNELTEEWHADRAAILAGPNPGEVTRTVDDVMSAKDPEEDEKPNSGKAGTG